MSREHKSLLDSDDESQQPCLGDLSASESSETISAMELEKMDVKSAVQYLRRQDSGMTENEVDDAVTDLLYTRALNALASEKKEAPSPPAKTNPPASKKQKQSERRKTKSKSGTGAPSGNAGRQNSGNRDTLSDPKSKSQPKGGSKSAGDANLKAQKEATEKEMASKLNQEKKMLTLLSNFPAKIRNKLTSEQNSVWKKLVDTFSAQYPVDIANGPSEQINKLKDLKIATKDPRGMFNDHALAAGVRAELRRRAVVKAVLEGHTHLAELFGNQHTTQFVTALGDHLRSCGWQGKLVYDVTGEHREAKDIEKRSGTNLSSSATFGIVIDLYEHYCMEDPDSLMDYLKKFHPQMETLYIIHNVMTGYAGVAPGYTWFAPKPDVRLVQIGKQNPFEHPYHSWLDVKSHTTNAGWFVDRSFQLSETASMSGTIFNKGGSSNPPPVFKVLKTPYQYFGVYQPLHRRALNWLSGESPMILLDKRMLDNAMAQFSNKNPTEFTYASIKLKITQMLRDEDWVRISSLLDYDNDRVAAVMTDLVMHKTFLQNTHSFKALNPHIREYRSVSSSSMFTEQPVKPWATYIKLFAKIFGGSVLAALLYLYGRKRAAGALLPVHNIFEAAVVGPVVEEVLKRFIPYKLFTAFLSIVETARDFGKLPWYLLLGRLAMHWVSALLPYKYGVMVHSVWNLIMCFRFFPEMRSLSSYRETWQAGRLALAVTNIRMNESFAVPVSGSFVTSTIIDTLLHLLESPVSSTEEYQNALVHNPETLEFSPGLLALDCPEYTLCPPATLCDEEINLPVDRTVFHGQVVISNKEELVQWFHNHHVPDPTTKIYHVLTFNGPSLWAPQSLKQNPYVAACLAYGRIAKPLPVKPLYSTWDLDSMYPMIVHSMNFFGQIVDPDWPFWQEMWKNHVQETGKWFKYARFWENRFDITASDSRVIKGIKKIQIMSKSDEVLVGKNIKKLIPRPIDNIAPIVAFVTGPLDYMLKMALLSRADSSDLDSFSFPRPCEYGFRQTKFSKFQFFWVPCLGFTQHDLTVLMQQFVLRDDAGMLLSHGDDSLLIHKYNGQFVMMESDLSSCDRSLTGPSLKFERDVINRALEWCGADPQFFEANEVAYKLSFADRIMDGIRVSLDGDAQRPTGCTRTSLMNTILTAMPMLMMHLHYCQHNLFKMLTDQPVIVDKYYYVHGLDAKVKIHHEREGRFPTGTFLKGIWLDTDCGTLAWTRLPSMALKMFKTLKPLPTLTKKYRKEKVELDEARRRYAVMIATSWKPFDLPYGIREWVEKWAVQDDLELPTIPLDGRVLPGTVNRYTFSNKQALLSLSEHYNVEPELFEDWCRRFMTLEPGQGYCHPVWSALGADY